jgi:cysteine-rich repeat protein
MEVDGVPFALDGPASRGFLSSDYSPSTIVAVDGAAAVAVHLLLNSYNSVLSTNGQTVATVVLEFADGGTVDVPLRIGENVRDWAPVPDGPYATVSHTTDVLTSEALHEGTLGQLGHTVLDKVSVLGGAESAGRRLTSVTVRDDLTGWGAPGFLLFGVTVERVTEVMAYVSNGDLYVADVSGADARPLTNGCTNCDHPTLSPDGKQVVFVRQSPEGTSQISATDLETGDTRLLFDAGRVTPLSPLPRPFFTSDGQRIVFHMLDAPRMPGMPARAKIFSLAVDGSEASPKRLSRSSNQDEVNPAPAADGSIAYVSKGRLRRMAADGRKRRTLFRRTSKVAEPDEPVFSPDAGKVVFRARTCDGTVCTHELFAVNADGRGMAQLTTKLLDASSPAVTPDGQTVVAAGRGGLWAMAANGSGELLVLENATSPATRLVDQLPAGCFQPKEAYVCYRPYRTTRATTLRTGPSPTAPAVLVNGVAVAVPAGTLVGASSVRTSACQITPGPRPVEGTPAFRFGYIANSETAVPGRGLAGWIAMDDLSDATGVSGLCGPEDGDFQCGQDPHSTCAQSRCNAAPTALNYPNWPLLQCNVVTPSYARLAPPATPGGKNGPVAGWLLPFDHFIPLRAASSDVNWKCVQVTHAQTMSPSYTWLYTSGPPSSWCGPSHCGNGVVEGAEQCDDGNNDPCDGCEADCRLSACGDGVACPSRGEECDDGNAVTGDGCDGNCTTTRCGNLQVTPPGKSFPAEECDDANANPCDGCNNCKFSKCGDGALCSNFGEQCDDGNRNDNDGCDSNCYPEWCGDGRTQPPREQCEPPGQAQICYWGNNCDLCTWGCQLPPTQDCHIDCCDRRAWLEVNIPSLTHWYCQNVGFDTPICSGLHGVRYRYWGSELLPGANPNCS